MRELGKSTEQPKENTAAPATPEVMKVNTDDLKTDVKPVEPVKEEPFVAGVVHGAKEMVKGAPSTEEPIKVAEVKPAAKEPTAKTTKSMSEEEGKDFNFVVPSASPKHQVEVSSTGQEKYKVFAHCTCQWEGRFINLAEAEAGVDKHIAANS